MTSQDNDEITIRQVIGLLLITPMVCVTVCAIFLAIWGFLLTVWSEGGPVITLVLFMVMFGIGGLLLHKKI